MSGTLSRKHSRVSVRRSMSRLVFIYSSPVSTRARVTIAWHAKRLRCPRPARRRSDPGHPHFSGSASHGNTCRRPSQAEDHRSMQPHDPRRQHHHHVQQRRRPRHRPAYGHAPHPNGANRASHNGVVQPGRNRQQQYLYLRRRRSSRHGPATAALGSHEPQPEADDRRGQRVGTEIQSSKRPARSHQKGASGKRRRRELGADGTRPVARGQAGRGAEDLRPADCV